MNLEAWSAKLYDWKSQDGGTFHSPSFGRNHEAILAMCEKRALFDGSVRVLEIGSGTGEHIHLWASKSTNATFFPSEVTAEGQASINALCKNSRNIVLPPLSVNLLSEDDLELKEEFDVVVAVNLLHVCPIKAVESLARLCHRTNVKRAAFYGPFRRNGQFTTESNERFHNTITAANPEFGLRDVESTLIPHFRAFGFEIDCIEDMPQNNFFVFFRRITKPD